ncbi:MAG TPA: AMP-dependent synthetase/ligase [candidate division Zixibacteria bacterium]|nr:AMP-dependent synthetase/ligase [candidate division Zixibacteria bacterium]
MGARETRTIHVGENIPASILAAADLEGGRTALIGAGGKGERVSYARLAQRVRSVAGGLRALGVRSRDRVALLGENCPEWAISYLAIQNAGATVIPLDVLLKPHEHLALIEESEPRAIIISEKFYETLADRLAERFPELPLVVMNAAHEGTVQLNELYSAEPYEQKSIDPDQPASLIFTSGTTGTPKAVILTHRNITHNIASVFAALRFCERDRFLSVLPLSHVYECTAGFLLPLHSGSTIVYARGFAAQSLIEDMRENKITVLIGMPLLYEKMLRGMKRKIREAPPARRALFNTLYKTSSAGRKIGLRPGVTLFRSLRDKAGMASLNMMVSGGAPLDPEIADFFETLGIHFLQGYGLTESSPVISVNLPDKNVIGSVGPPLPGFEVRIDNPDSEGVGEILARGDSVTPGYLNDPEKTAQILRDGWLCTGDLGKIENGCLYICGRAKNLIVSAGGKNIYPEEIEGKLLENDLIGEALVLGRTKPGKQGEEVHALIYPNPESLPTALPDIDVLDPQQLTSEPVRRVIADIVRSANEQLADYKRISRWDLVGQEFEKTASRKIKRALYK